jgi:hypothetical protein
MSVIRRSALGLGGIPTMNDDSVDLPGRVD